MSCIRRIQEIYVDTNGDRASISNLQIVLNNYPTEKGYRVESFISPKFIRISVYKVK